MRAAESSERLEQEDEGRALMSSLQIPKPKDKDALEELACEIYRVEWNTTDIQIVGRSGQSQGGIDILGTRAGTKVGVQCKCYHSTPFTMATVTDDVRKADEDGLKIECLIFVTTRQRVAKVATDSHELDTARRAAGKFGVEVVFWEDFEALLRKHPAVTARYVPEHPLSVSQRTLSAAENTQDTVEAIRALLEQLPGDQALIKRQLEDIAARLPSAAASTAVPVTNHDTDHRESTGRASVEEIRQEAMIDVVRDMIREIRTSDALLQLKKLGNPDDLASNWLRFRWYTNAGAIAWLNGETETSFEHYERAYELMPSDPKAIANRMRSLMLAGQVEAARKLCRQTIAANPGHEHAWSVLIALDRLNEDGLRALGPPAAILGSRDVQFALGAAAGARGEHELATRLFAECLRGEPASHEVRRALVTSCVTWAMEAGIGGVPSLLSESLRQYLTEALSPLSDALSRIENTEAHPFALELANNSFVGLKLLGEDGLASQLAVRFFHRFPTAPALVAASARENDTAKKWPRFRDELMQRLDQLSTAGRIAVGEVAANLGDLTWFTACAAQPAPDESDARTPLILRLLETVAVWKSGERDAAVAAMRSFNKEHPTFVLGSTMLSQMLRIAGDHAGAISALAAALKLVDANTIGSDKLAIADAFFECDAYVVAAKLYSDLVQRPGDDQATFRLVRSLIAINDRQGAARVLARVPTELRDAYPIRRLELLLAHEVGDLNRLVELLKAERVRSPQRGEIALNLAAAYLLMNRFDELRTLLADNHAFEQTPPRIEFEFAKLQLQFGEPEKGHERLISLWRNNPSDGIVASYVVSQQTLYPDPAVGAAATLQSPDLAVRISVEGGASHWVAIDSNTTASGRPWPSCVAPGDPTALAIRAASLNRSFELPGMFGRPAVIEELVSYRQFMVREAMECIQRHPTGVGVLQAIDVPDANAFVKQLTVQAARLERAIKSALNEYQRHTKRLPLTLGMLAQRIGRNELELVHGWPAANYQMIVSGGSDDVIRETMPMLAAAPEIVVDLLTLFELRRLNALHALVRRGRKILVPAVLLRRLNFIRYGFAARPEMIGRGASFYTSNGKARLRDASRDAEVFDTHARDVLAFVTEYCEVVPVFGPAQMSAYDQLLANSLDPVSADVFLLCRERDLPLASIDLKLLAHLAAVHPGRGVDLATVIADASVAGTLTRDQRARVLAELAASGRTFVGFGNFDLLTLIRAHPALVDPRVVDLLRVCSHPGIDVPRALRLWAEFLGSLVELGVPPAVVATYAYEMRSALVAAKRIISHREIDLMIIESLEVAYGPKASELSATERLEVLPLLERKPMRRFARRPVAPSFDPLNATST